MPKTRRLTDLYVVGKELKLNDGDGEAVTVWMQKLNPVEQETAMRYANAARARHLALKKHPEEDEAMALRNQLFDFDDRDAMIEYVIASDLLTFAQAREAELAADEEWSKHEYIQGLRDAWEGGLNDTWQKDKDDAEASRVYVELKRFSDTVDEHVKAKHDDLKRSYEQHTDEKIEEITLEKVIDMEADMEWLREYRRCEVWQSVRDERNHHQKYFSNRDEVDQLSLEILGSLIASYQGIAVEPTEGKDLPGTATSSESPEQPEKVETPVSSGLSVVAQ